MICLSDDEKTNAKLNQYQPDSPRVATMAKKSTSPIKFFLFNRPKLASSNSISSSSSDVKEINQTGLPNKASNKRINQIFANKSESSSSFNQIEQKTNTILFNNSIIYDKKWDPSLIKNETNQKFITEFESKFNLNQILKIEPRSSYFC